MTLMKGFEVVSDYPQIFMEEEIYILTPDGYPCPYPKKVLHLYGALYGTKRAAQCWWKYFSKVLSKMICLYCVDVQSFYILKHHVVIVFIWIHVDNGQIFASSRWITHHIYLKRFRVIVLPGVERSIQSNCWIQGSGSTGWYLSVIAASNLYYLER